MIRVPRLTQAAGLALAIAALAACNGGLSVPSGGSASGQSYPEAGVAQKITPYAANASLACNAPNQGLPGKYAEMIVLGGKVTGSTFNSGKTGLYILARFVRATPMPTPTPGTTPTPKPTPTNEPTAPPGEPLYFYTGTYALKTYGQGCFYLITSESGAVIKKDKSNALAVGVPQFNAPNTNVLKPVEGALDVAIGNLGANGGKGTATLLGSKGSPNVDTGTITLTGRILIKP